MLPSEGLDGDPRRLELGANFNPYAQWIIYERRKEFGSNHGPDRFSLLFIAGEGAATFQALYHSNRCAPLAITLIRSDAFAGNWTNFFRPELIFARGVLRNPFGAPEYLFCEFGEEPESPWPSHPHLWHTVASPNGIRLRLWGRSPYAQSRN
jgi:hypothetical protein